MAADVAASWTASWVLVALGRLWVGAAVDLVAESSDPEDRCLDRGGHVTGAIGLFVVLV
ncbi:MAG: hypothetical protein ACRDZQ_10285 [Acidimicrobiales bacterium]